MFKVGITGGIGSGKTTVCSIFSTLGIPVYYADIRAKELMIFDENLKQQITNLFGNEAYQPDGGLNTKFIASKAFTDKSLLHQLNAMVHPAVFEDSIKWFQQHEDKPYALYEAAIMFESGNNKMMDKMITVYAPEEDRIARIIARDKVGRTDVLERINKQLPEEEKIKRADFIIYNDAEHALKEQVIAIHEQLISIN